MEAVRIWAIRAGSAGQADAIFLEKGQIALSCQEVGGDVSLLPPSRGAFKDAFVRGAPEAPASSVPAQAGQLYRFVHEMRIGARVLYPRKSDRTVHWGEIVGPTDPTSPTGAPCAGSPNSAATISARARSMSWAPRCRCSR
jgi:restriction system protein